MNQNGNEKAPRRVITDVPAIRRHVRDFVAEVGRQRKRVLDAIAPSAYKRTIADVALFQGNAREVGAEIRRQREKLIDAMLGERR